MSEVRPLYVPTPYQDAAEAGRLILRDGTTASVRVAQPSDRETLQRFFARLSPESRYRRFASVSLPADDLLAVLCDASDFRRHLTLIVSRTVEGQARVIATGSYLAKDRDTAELTLAVDDAFQGKGLGSLLFERLALLAVRHGLKRFWAMTHADNLPMIDILRSSGFALAERHDDGRVEVDCSVRPSEASVRHSEALDRLFTAVSLRPFFHPASVAVVGASRDPAHIGHRVLEALIANHFTGTVYPVNPSAASVRSIRCYPSVRDVPEPVDLAVLVVPRSAMPQVVDDCAARGVKALVAISAGFGEVGAEGRALQARLVEAARGYGMRLIGPNCLGLIATDPEVRLNASFSPWYPARGSIALMSQSGALGIAILALANQMKLGLSHFVSVGNKADVSGNDLLQYWEQDPATNTILLYLESFGNPRRFARIARRVSRVKPIVAVKSGRTRVGQRAAGSHTAALAASDVAVEALFHQTGVMRAESLEELFDLASALSSQPLPRGRRAAIITNAGGPGILCADACETAGLQVEPLAEATVQRLAAVLPTAASLANPIDMVASATPEQFQETIAAVLASPEVDALIIIYIPVGVVLTNRILEGIRDGIRRGRAAGGAGKPIFACLMGDTGELERLVLDGERIPTYVFPEAPARVLGKLAAYAAWRAQPQGVVFEFDDARPEEARACCRRVLARGGGWLSAEEARQVLVAMGLPVVEGGLARDAEEAVQVARRIGWPVAVKLASHAILHKTEHQAVLLDIPDEDGVRRAVETIRQRLAEAHRLEAMDGVVVQRMIRGGVEVMVGMAEDASFGPLVAFGLGGIHVEVLRDVQFRIAPLTDLDAKDMVRGIRGIRLLEGYRGHETADLAALEELLQRVSRLAEDVPEIAELDLNPIFALPPGQGCRIADVRIRVASPPSPPVSASSTAT